MQRRFTSSINVDWASCLLLEMNTIELHTRVELIRTSMQKVQVNIELQVITNLQILSQTYSSQNEM